MGEQTPEEEVTVIDPVDDDGQQDAGNGLLQILDEDFEPEEVEFDDEAPDELEYEEGEEEVENNG